MTSFMNVPNKTTSAQQSWTLTSKLEDPKKCQVQPIIDHNQQKPAKYPLVNIYSLLLHVISSLLFFCVTRKKYLNFLYFFPFILLDNSRFIILNELLILFLLPIAKKWVNWKELWKAPEIFSFIFVPQSYSTSNKNIFSFHLLFNTILYT